MAYDNLSYYQARATEEDRRAAGSAGPVRAAHREMAAAYRERLDELRAKANPTILGVEPARGRTNRPRSGGAAQATVKVVIVEPRDRRQTGDVFDQQRAAL